MERKRFRFRKVHLLAVPAFLLALFLAGEVAYRLEASRRYEDLLDQVRKAHADGPVKVVGIWRFGESTRAFRVSLMEDLWESKLADVGLPGRLTVPHAPSARHACAQVTIEAPVRREAPSRHAFSWNPVERRFTGSTLDDCPCEGCPAYSGRPPRWHPLDGGP